MRILLLSMPDVTPSSADSMLLPSLGIASLAGNLDLSRHQVQIADLVLRRKDFRRYLRELLQKTRPQLVGLTGLTCSVPTALEIAAQIKSEAPETRVVFGGYMALCHDDELSQPPQSHAIDFLVRGEGEITFRELVDGLESGADLREIPGLLVKADGHLIHNPPRALCDLAEIALPNRRARLLRHGFHLWGVPADVVETSRGCTFDCSFCCVAEQYHRHYREFALERVLEDISEAHHSGTRFIVLADDNITLDLDRLDRFCDALLRARLRGLRLFAQAAVKPIARHPDLVKKMRHAGFEVVFLGLENLIERNLKFLNKKTSNFELAQQALANLRRNNIISAAGIILGNPQDTREDLWENFHRVEALQIDFPNFMTLTPFPKTRIRRELEAQNLLTNPGDYKRYDLIQANLKTHFLSEPELFHLVKLFFKKYYASVRFLKTNRMLRKYKWFVLKYIGREVGHWLRVSFRKQAPTGKK